MLSRSRVQTRLGPNGPARPEGVPLKKPVEKVVTARRGQQGERFTNRRMISCALNRHNTAQSAGPRHLSGMTKTVKDKHALVLQIDLFCMAFTLKPHEPSAVPDGGTARIRLAAS
jgi:hypothetical protein